jgi:hypothetical protein
MPAPELSRRSALLTIAAGLAGAATPDSATISVNGGTIEASFDGGSFDLGRPAILEWIRRAAQAVATFYGEFPVPRVDLRVHAVKGERGVFGGTTYGEPSPRVLISVGEHAAQQHLANDWMLTHEFVHLAFPSLSRQHHWIEEGLSTYVEPLARVQAGQMTPERYWFELERDVPQGLPRAGDQGLDRTHTWGRTYWGGALFCFVSEVHIRERTGNRMGLQNALRAIVHAGGNIQQNWPLRRALETGDAAAGVSVLVPLYDEWKDKPVEVDLAAMWRRLGVLWKEDTVALDDSAPGAAIRRAILAGPGNPS